MKINRIIINIKRFSFLLILALLLSCVKQIEPDIELLDTDKYVISGILSDVAEPQYISVSKTSSLSNPHKIPVNSCIVKVVREDLVELYYSEIEDGKYAAMIYPNFIDKNMSYKVMVETPNGEIMQSTYESFTKLSPVGDVYWEVDRKEDSNIDGYQFYVDLQANESDSRYYLYDITETFEHHSHYPLIYYWNGVLNHVVPPGYSKMYCWVTTDIRDLFPLSTKGFSNNSYDRYKLNYTVAITQRLQHTYSLLVKKYSLSESAYNYWEQMRKNLHQSGGMYNSQPIAVKGNISHQNNNNDKTVLGYFGVSSVSERRIFVPPSPFEIIDNSCVKRVLRFGYREISPAEYPAYIMADAGGLPTGTVLERPCVDCTALGGVTTKPTYWPN